MRNNAITYHEEKEIAQKDLLELYTNAKWSLYTSDPDLLSKAIQNSQFVLTAKHKNKLVGLIRTIGDGATIVYFQDILVHGDYKRMNIGTTLMSKTLERFQTIRQKVLLTDDNPETRGFYESLGFKSCDQGELVSFIKIKK